LKKKTLEDIEHKANS